MSKLNWCWRRFLLTLLLAMGAAAPRCAEQYDAANLSREAQSMDAQVKRDASRREIVEIARLFHHHQWPECSFPSRANLV
jgi:hypothetical protein